MQEWALKFFPTVTQKRLNISASLSLCSLMNFYCKYKNGWIDIQLKYCWQSSKLGVYKEDVGNKWNINVHSRYSHENYGFGWWNLRNIKGHIKTILSQWSRFDTFRKLLYWLSWMLYAILRFWSFFMLYRFYCVLFAFVYKILEQSLIMAWNIFIQ